MNEGYTLNQPPNLTCPECGGSLIRSDDGPAVKYICHIGHVLTGRAMLEAQQERIEHLATGLLAMLNEQRELCRQLIETKQGDQRHLERLRSVATQNAEAIRYFLNGTPLD
jgi:hypothetical protein